MTTYITEINILHPTPRSACLIKSTSKSSVLGIVSGIMFVSVAVAKMCFIKRCIKVSFSDFIYKGHFYTGTSTNFGYFSYKAASAATFAIFNGK